MNASFQDQVELEFKWCREHLLNQEGWSDFVVQMAKRVASINAQVSDDYDGRFKRNHRDQRAAVTTIRRELKRLNSGNIGLLWTVFDNEDDDFEEAYERCLQGHAQLIADCDRWLEYIDTQKQAELILPRLLVQWMASIAGEYLMFKVAKNKDFTALCFKANRLCFGSEHTRETVEKWIDAYVERSN